MKEWNFKVKSNPVQTRKKLEDALSTVNGFVFHIQDHQDNTSVMFKVRKRILYAWYMVFQNWTIVNGKLAKATSADKTHVEVSFSQHFLIQLIVYTHVFLGLGLLLALILGIGSNSSLYVLAGILLIIGIAIWIGVQRKFEKDIQTYKALISQILEA